MVVVVGSSNIDLIASVDRLPSPGETLLGHRVVQSFGGKGANQAVAAARAGAEVGFLSKVGHDPHGDLIEQHLTTQGLSRIVLLRDAAAQTGVAMILVDAAGENQIVVVPGSNQQLTPADVQRHAELISGARVLLVQMEIPIETVQESLRLAKHHGLLTILNPAPACPLPPECFSMIDILTPNEREACVLSGVTDPTEAAGILVNRGVGTVVVTRGAEGALVSRGKDVLHVPAFIVDAIDSTGAGDAFSGAFACGLAEGLSIEEALEMAVAAGALATTGHGAQAAMPTRSDINRLRRTGVRRMQPLG